MVRELQPSAELTYKKVPRGYRFFLGDTWIGGFAGELRESEIQKQMEIVFKDWSKTHAV